MLQWNPEAENELWVHYFDVQNKKIPSVQTFGPSGLFLNQPWSTEKFLLFLSDQISWVDWKCNQARSTENATSHIFSQK